MSLMPGFSALLRPRGSGTVLSITAQADREAEGRCYQRPIGPDRFFSIAARLYRVGLERPGVLGGLARHGNDRERRAGLGGGGFADLQCPRAASLLAGVCLRAGRVRRELLLDLWHGRAVRGLWADFLGTGLRTLCRERGAVFLGICLDASPPGPHVRRLRPAFAGRHRGGRADHGPPVLLAFRPHPGRLHAVCTDRRHRRRDAVSFVMFWVAEAGVRILVFREWRPAFLLPAAAFAISLAYGARHDAHTRITPWRKTARSCSCRALRLSARSAISTRSGKTSLGFTTLSRESSRAGMLIVWPEGSIPAYIPPTWARS